MYSHQPREPEGDTLHGMDGSDLDTRVRSEIIRWRQRRGWTQPEFATRLRPYLPEERKQWAVQPNISRFENGAAVDLTTIHAMARAIGVPITILLGQSSREASRIASALDDPQVHGFVEALRTGKLQPEVIRAAVSMLRQLAGLPMISQTLEPTSVDRLSGSHTG